MKLAGGPREWDILPLSQGDLPRGERLGIPHRELTTTYTTSPASEFRDYYQRVQERYIEAAEAQEDFEAREEADLAAERAQLAVYEAEAQQERERETEDVSLSEGDDGELVLPQPPTAHREFIQENDVSGMPEREISFPDSDTSSLYNEAASSPSASDDDPDSDSEAPRRPITPDNDHNHAIPLTQENHGLEMLESEVDYPDSEPTSSLYNEAASSFSSSSDSDSDTDTDSEGPPRLITSNRTRALALRARQKPFTVINEFLGSSPLAPPISPALQTITISLSWTELEYEVRPRIANALRVCREELGWRDSGFMLMAIVLAGKILVGEFVRRGEVGWEEEEEDEEEDEDEEGDEEEEWVVAEDGGAGRWDDSYDAFERHDVSDF